MPSYSSTLSYLATSARSSLRYSKHAITQARTYCNSNSMVRKEYSYVNQDDKNHFIKILQQTSRLLDHKHDVAHYVTDWHGRYHDTSR